MIIKAWNISCSHSFSPSTSPLLPSPPPPFPLLFTAYILNKGIISPRGINFDQFLTGKRNLAFLCMKYSCIYNAETYIWYVYDINISMRKYVRIRK